MIRGLLLLGALGASASALEDALPGPVTVRAGWSYFAPGPRSFAGKNGIALGVGIQDGKDGLFGRRGIDALYRTAHAAGGRVDDLGVAYVERIPWQNQVYGGFGAGLWAYRMADRRDDGDGVHASLRPGVEGLVGYQFAPPADGVRLALELTVIGVLPTSDDKTSGIVAALVAGF